VTDFSRRRLLAGTAGLAILPVPALAAFRTAAPMRLVAGTRTLEVNGRAAPVFRLSGPGDVSGLRLAPEQKFTVDLVNEAAVPTIIHWHGQVPPWTQDGFPWPQTPPIPTGGSHRYDYVAQPGTYWMHSHQGLQEQTLMAAPLIVHDKASLREDRQEIVLMLHDFSFHTPEALLDALVHPPMDQMSGMAGMGGMAKMGGMTKMGDDGAGAQAMKMDLNDIDFDAFLANDRTLADPEIIRVEHRGRVRLRVINAAASTQFWLSLGGITGTVVAVDGSPVHPVTGEMFPISMAQRLDIMLEMPADGVVPIIAQVEGTAKQTGIILATPGAPIPRVATLAATVAPPADLSLEQRLAARNPLSPRRADIVHRVVLDGGMIPYRWSLNGQYWPKITPLMVEHGQRVVIDMVNRTAMAHPMHLHGHDFQVMALNGKRLSGARRDTVMVPAKGRVAIAFDAANPGRWPFHCHNLYHMVTGMMTEVRYRSFPMSGIY
jgi:FtsP/CotA-like multicopper oxidase with cupredoxin domain